ncbi:hypothetical protein DFH09DRAFT_1141075 [Mycena vulgaris]|nr:hypothetical protein DFH09DRAFT_1141075 [Mycena vulgaris]
MESGSGRRRGRGKAGLRCCIVLWSMSAALSSIVLFLAAPLTRLSSCPSHGDACITVRRNNPRVLLLHVLAVH